MKMVAIVSGLSTLLVSFGAFAGDISTNEFLGFSPDGSAVGYTQSGTQDGSGYSYCTLSLINTDKNTFIIPPVNVVLESENPTDSADKACDQAKSKAKATLVKLQLNPRLGGQVFAKLITEEGAAGTRSVKFSTYAMPNAMYNNEVAVTEVPTGKIDDYDLPEVKLKLTLSTEGKTTTLQEDKTLPASRSGVYAYELEEGRVFETAKKSVKVFVIRMYTHGFEGPDVRSMYVSGTEVY